MTLDADLTADVLPEPPQLSAQQRHDICAILAVGGTRELAARYVGCTRETLCRAAERDPQFLEQLQAAEAKHELLYLKYLGEAAQSKQNWRAVTWMLERRYPDRYSARRGNTLTLDEVGQLLSLFAQKVIEAVPAQKHRLKILACLEEIGEQAEAAIHKKQSRRAARRPKGSQR